ncbi:hypothetical protein KOW79_002337 [Hemibagrus wyckioides]|uniref:IRG-type G domain-containing protein n=1 Tax=Hemibagrus wyckioides TaxID=337641 RepID=A0A9D3P6F6_9TELE|nr:hypothetical protein KOW79_002337 [Hemibagrus wyckioides]
MASEFGISEAEVNEMTSVLHSRVATDVVAQVEGMLTQMKSVTLNFAITGESDCEKNLRNGQVEQPRVFLLSCFHPQCYDFPALQMTLLEELEGHKRHALLLSLPNLGSSLIQSKREALAQDVRKKAIVASLSSVTRGATHNPIVPKLMETFKKASE